MPSEDEELRTQVVPLIKGALQQLQSAMAIDRPPSALTIVFHPTGDSYRRATGRPWWTSASTVFDHDTATIHLVPVRALLTNGRLAGALRHELVHDLAGQPLRTRPLWVQEGLAQHFAGERQTTSPSATRAQFQPARDIDGPNDRAFRQSTDRTTTERAYRAALACVTRDLARGIPWRDLGAR
jgi:hypothetical protein